MLYIPLMRNEFRLVTILPTEVSDPQILSCTLEKFTLILPPPYVALSYCWGDAVNTIEIIINNQKCQTRTNLVAALLRLRALGYTRIWIDALCINQQDAEEKNGQLLKMGTIYRRAKHTVAWLGERERGSDNAIELMARIFNSQMSHYGVSGYLSSIGTEKRDEILQLLLRPYWHRVWIIQELVLSQEVIILCGSRQTSWKIMQATFRALRDFCPALWHFENIVKFRDDAMHDRPIHFLDALFRSQQSIATEPRDKAFALIWLAYNGAAFIPRPNYEQSISELCFEMTMSAISLSRSLDVVALLGNCSGDNSEPTWIPNWLSSGQRSASSQRRFSYLTRKPVFLNHVCGDDLNPYECFEKLDRVMQGAEPRVPHRNLWNATNGHNAQFSLSRNTIKVKGLIIDAVSHLGSCWSEDLTAPKPTAFSPLYPIKNNRYSAGSRYNDPPPPSREGLVRAIFYLLFYIGNTAPHEHPEDFRINHESFRKLWTDIRWRGDFPRLHNWLFANSSFPIHGETLRNLIEFDLSTVSNPNVYDSIYDIEDTVPTGVQSILEWNMRLMVTQEGLIGWADDKAVAGDQIALILGCTVPVILRQRPNGGWNIIGDSIIYGLMDGGGVANLEVEGLDYLTIY